MKNMKLEKKEGIILGAFLLLGIISLFFDRTIAVYFKSVQNEGLTRFFLIFDPLWVMIILYAIILFLVWTKVNHKWTFRLLLTLVLTLGISLALKLTIMRDRPAGIKEFFPIIHLVDYSFPSNHSSLIFSTLPILDKELKKLKVAWIFLAVIISFSRIYLGVHYLSDVIFGGLIGYLIGFAVLNWKK